MSTTKTPAGLTTLPGDHTLTLACVRAPGTHGARERNLFFPLPGRLQAMNRYATSGRAQKITHWVGLHQGELVAFVSKLVAAESPSLEPLLHDDVLRQLSDALQGLGFYVRRLAGRTTAGHLYARPAVRLRQGRYQLVIGHCDTVWPEGTLRQMPVRISDGKLQGPGMYDMKAGLAQLVFGLKALQALKLTPKVRPVVFINSDEEIGSRESTRYIKRLDRGADRALVLEPALGPEGALKTAEAGAELVARLTGLEALNLLHESSLPRLRTLLQERLGYRFAGPPPKPT